MNRSGLILILFGLILIVAGFQGKLNAVFAALFAPDTLTVGTVGTGG